MIEYAMSYIRQFGFSIIPMEPYSKRAMRKWKQYQTEYPSQEQIWEWWQQIPYAGIAAVLGPLSKLLAVDVDGPEAHEVLVNRLKAIPIAPTSISGSGKPYRYHLLFRHPRLRTRAKATPWHPDLEFRGQGGLLILPPSYHSSGNQYAWAQGRSLNDLALPEVPEAITTELRAIAARRKKRPVASAREKRDMRAIPRINGISRTTKSVLRGEYADGPRWNDRLYRAACDLAGCGVPLDEAMPLLITGAEPWDMTEEDKARRTIESAYSEERIPARELVTQLHQDEPIRTWHAGSITVREMPHPERRYLPPSTSYEL